VAGIRGVWPAIDSVRVNLSDYLNGGGTKLVYTVAANKRLFISSCGVATLNEAVQNVYSYVRVRNVADVKVYDFILHYHSAIGPFFSNQMLIPALEIEAGWDIIIVNSLGNYKTRAFLFGWLEDD